MGLHIHQVEVDELAASPPWPHADVQVLDAIGGEEEGTVWIHLWNDTWRYSHPQRLIPALKSPAWSINQTKLLLKACTPIPPLLNPVPPIPRNTLGLLRVRKDKSHSGTARASPAQGFPHTGFAWGAFAFPLQDSNGVFLPFIIHISNYGRTNSKEIVSLQTVSLTQIICPPGFRANDPTHDSSNQKIIITNALRLSVVHSSEWAAFCFLEGVSLGWPTPASPQPAAGVTSSSWGWEGKARTLRGAAVPRSSSERRVSCPAVQATSRRCSECR